jgi:hypothetical protein
MKIHRIRADAEAESSSEVHTSISSPIGAAPVAAQFLSTSGRCLPPPPVQEPPRMASQTTEPCFLPPPHAPGVAMQPAGFTPPQSVLGPLPLHESTATLHKVLVPPPFVPTVATAGASLPPPPEHTPTVVAQPSRGSELHAAGLCTPCAWFWKPQGCLHGDLCLRCHLCLEGEVKKRKAVKKALIRAQAATESPADQVLRAASVPDEPPAALA